MYTIPKRFFNRGHMKKTGLCVLKNSFIHENRTNQLKFHNWRSTPVWRNVFKPFTFLYLETFLSRSVSELLQTLSISKLWNSVLWEIIEVLGALDCESGLHVVESKGFWIQHSICCRENSVWLFRSFQKLN